MTEWKALLNNSSFLKKLNKYLLIGFSTLLLIYIAQAGVLQNIQLAQAISCNPGEPINDCHTLSGTGHTYCVFDPNGNTESDCKVETCFNGGNPPDCGGPADQQGTDQTVPCMTNSSLCGENTQFCENTTGGGSATIFKHAGICDPSSGARDANGCVFQFDNVRSFTGPNCQDVSAPPAPQPPAPGLTCAPGSDRSTPEPNCNKAGAPLGLCCTICGNGKDHCDRFNGENAGNCPADCAAPAPAQAAPAQPAQQQSNNQTNSQPVNVTVHGGNAVAEGGSATAVSSGNTQIGGNQTQTVNPAPAQAAPTASPSPSPAPSVSPAPSASPAPAPAAPAGGTSSSTSSSSSTNTNTNTNSSTNSNTNTITIGSAAQAARVVTAQAGQPRVRVQVAGVSSVPVTELPKTGLSIFVWAAGAFIPLGFSVKRFGSVSKRSSKLLEKPDNVCQERVVKMSIT